MLDNIRISIDDSLLLKAEDPTKECYALNSYIICVAFDYIMHCPIPS